MKKAPCAGLAVSVLGLEGTTGAGLDHSFRLSTTRFALPSNRSRVLFSTSFTSKVMPSSWASRFRIRSTMFFILAVGANEGRERGSATGRHSGWDSGRVGAEWGMYEFGGGATDWLSEFTRAETARPRRQISSARPLSFLLSYRIVT